MVAPLITPESFKMVAGSLDLSPSSESVRIPLSLQVQEGLYPVDVRVSPDGSAVAINAVERPGSSSPKGRLLVRRMDAVVAQSVPGSAGVLGFSFSPEGDWLAFIAPIAEESSVARIYKVPVDGKTPPLAVVDLDPNWNGANIVWLANGNLVLMTRSSPKQLVSIPSAGGMRPFLVALSTEVQGDVRDGHLAGWLPGGHCGHRPKYRRGFPTRGGCGAPQTFVFRASCLFAP